MQSYYKSQSLLQITKLQVAAGKNRNTPVLVHCSAGVGRFFLFLVLSKLFSSFALFVLFFSVDILLKLILLLMLLLLLLVHYCAGVGRCFPFLVLSKLFSNFCLFVCVVRLLFSKKIVFYLSLFSILLLLLLLLPLLFAIPTNFRTGVTILSDILRYCADHNIDIDIPKVFFLFLGS